MEHPNKEQLSLLEERRIASVATISPDGLPHLTSVWFLYEDEEFFLAIPSSSAKGRNLSNDTRIAIMIDVRETYREAGITACGRAEVISGEAAATIVKRIHEKYMTQDALEDPLIGPVFDAIDDIAIRIRVTKWISWDMVQIDKQFFGGRLQENKSFKQIVP